MPDLEHDSVPLGEWRYDIQYGPEGEANYAWVYDDNGTMVGTMRTHHAAAVVNNANAALRSQSPEPSSSEPVAWRCEDLILPRVSIIDDWEHARMRMLQPDAWKVTPLYAAPTLSPTVSQPVTGEVTDETAILRRLADGDAIVYSQDGDDCWFSEGDRAHIAGKSVISLRDKGYIESRVDADDDTDNYRGMAEYDAISAAGRAALSAQERG